ncbi:MAG TPA: formate/nitrite transporter family protein [Sporichthyaceae bacterium]|nr:formate/nitrite transporter family protein [Sporichthyaceae bacterium]
MAQASGRLDAGEIHEQAVANGRAELNRPVRALAFSGLAAGLLMGLTGLGVAGSRAVLPGVAGAEFIALLFYPLGFLAVVIGRAQLFTENTLFPVLVVLQERRHLWITAQLWVVVFAGNVAGAALFAALTEPTGALQPAAVQELVQLGVTATAAPLTHVLTGAVLGGWLIATMAWLVSGAQHTIGQVVLIWLVTFVVGLLHLAHCIASSGYILAAAMAGRVSVGRYAAWLGTATAGNIIGGVVMVALLNHSQVHAGGGRARQERIRATHAQTSARQRNDALAVRMHSPGGDPDGTLTIACECSDPGCSRQVSMSGGDYRRLRQEPTWFALVDGHPTPGVELVVQRHVGYVVVELSGDAAEAADEEDTQTVSDPAPQAVSDPAPTTAVPR